MRQHAPILFILIYCLPRLLLALRAHCGRDARGPGKDGSLYCERSFQLTQCQQKFQLRVLQSLWLNRQRNQVSTVPESKELLANMTRAEKAELLQWLVSDLGDTFPGIESRAGVAGGEPCIVRTRIPVWLLEQARRLGTSEAALLRAYPTLRAQDLANAWAYVESHPEEIERHIAENESDESQ